MMGYGFRFPMRLLLPLLLLVACAPRVNERGQPIDEYGRTKEDAARYAQAVEKKRLKPGMHEGEVEAVMGGEPERIEEQMHNRKSYVVWQYRKRSLDLYFDHDGYLMFWRAPY